MKKDFDFFMGNLHTLFGKYARRFLVIHEATVSADFNSLTESYEFAVEKYGLGHFSLYECKSPNYENYVQRFANNNVSFQ